MLLAHGVTIAARSVLEALSTGKPVRRSRQSLAIDISYDICSLIR